MKTPQTGYWTFFCNPKKWEIDKELKAAGENLPYRVSHKLERFNHGEMGVIRVGPDTRSNEVRGKRERLRAGVYAIVKIMKPTLDGRIQLKIIKNCLNNPVLLEALKANKRFKDEYILNGSPQKSTMPLQKQAYEIISKELEQPTNGSLSKSTKGNRSENDWSERECYFAVWAYDQLDSDREIVKKHLFEAVSNTITRSAKSVEFKVQNVSSFDPRPRKDKPISTAPNAQKLLGNVFKWYWGDRLKARELYGTFVQQEHFGLPAKEKINEQSKKPTTRTIIIEEGAEGHSTSKTRKRSAKLVKEGRKYFKNLDPEGKLRCQTCEYIKPDSIKGEIIQLHHTEMVSELDKNGKKVSLEVAVKTLVPLCPNCHQIAHSSIPPLSKKEIKKIINNGRN
jgi:predicted HNH restriction endonuclease